jgi:hypothetical protein
VRPVDQLADDISLRHDSADVASVIGYDHSAQIVITQQLEHLHHRGLRPDRDDVVALGVENLTNPHRNLLAKD